MAAPTFTNYVEDADGRAQLRQMIHHHRHGAEELLVPPRVRREVALEVLVLEVTPLLEAEETQRAADVARFYVLPAAVKNFSLLLLRTEQTAADLVRSIECLRVMGDLGSDEQQSQSGEYFAYLLGHPFFEKVAPQFLDCCFHLDAAGTGEKLAARLEGQLQTAQKSASSQAGSEEPSPEAIMLEEYLSADLPVIQRAKSLKRQLLAEKDALKRATGLARLYLGLDAYGGVDWPKWSGFEIMRERLQTNETNAVAGLRAALEAAGPGESPEFLAQARGRALKAILFLKGELDEQQKRWLAADNTRHFQLQG